MSLWHDKLVVTTVNFVENSYHGVSVYALNWNQMINGMVVPRGFQAPLDPIAHWIGSGLLAADVDGYYQPDKFAPIPLFGISDDVDLGVMTAGGYVAAIDAISIWKFSVDWSNTEAASFDFVKLWPTSPFDSAMQCTGADSGYCIPQKDTTQKLDFRRSVTSRLMNQVAYRRFDETSPEGPYESMVMNSGVEAYAGVAGVR